MPKTVFKDLSLTEQQFRLDLREYWLRATDKGLEPNARREAFSKVIAGQQAWNTVAKKNIKLDPSTIPADGVINSPALENSRSGVARPLSMQNSRRRAPAATRPKASISAGT